MNTDFEQKRTKGTKRWIGIAVVLFFFAGALAVGLLPLLFLLTSRAMK